MLMQRPKYRKRVASKIISNSRDESQKEPKLATNVVNRTT